MEKTKKLNLRFWISVLILGLAGQFAWTIENMYLNVFLYHTVSSSADAIAVMVGASAAVATLTALFMGALSDKLGRRRVFIIGGYILWGISTAFFGFVSLNNISALFPAANAVLLGSILIIALDCLMTFFGSTANDAALNAYITENTDATNRGRVEAVLVTLPLLSMLVIFGFFDGLTKRGAWQPFFLIFGILVTAVGILAIFLLPKETVVKREDSYFKNIFYGFRPSVVREHKLLYIAFAAFALFHISVQVFFPYLIIYMQEYLRLDNYAIVLGVVLLVSSLISVLSGKLMDKIGKLTFVFPALLVMSIGLWLMFFARGAVSVVLAGIVMMGGYMLVNAALSGIIRDMTPKEKVGLFQGVRMIFQVLLPMIIGPFIGSFIIRNSERGVYEELGVVKQIPIPGIFIGAAVVLILAVLPIGYLKKKEQNKE